AVIYEKDDLEIRQNMVMKVKPHGDEIVEMLNSLAAACGGKLATVYNDYKSLTGFQYTHAREQEIYSKLPSDLTPKIFGLCNDPVTDTYVILMEYLQDVTLLNSVMQPKLWTNAHIEKALIDIAKWHALNLNKQLSVDKKLWSDAASENYMQDLKPLWQELLNNAARSFPDLYTSERISLLQHAIDTIEVYQNELRSHPKTLIHNDFNPRNTCFKTSDGQDQLCVYDWELATFHLPQYDVVELLCFVLDEDRYHLRDKFLEFYRLQLNQLTGKFEDKSKFERGFYLSAFDFGLHRLGMYMMAHSVSPYPYLPRVVNSYFSLIVNG
ncbi:MAG: peedicted hydroxymethylglutaryl-CoA reductase, partial [Daejeonella sp.]|nr:peedicted hydroxymethylglutaryl-CoA reductase [Daejeonella sp.]